MVIIFANLIFIVISCVSTTGYIYIYATKKEQNKLRGFNFIIGLISVCVQIFLLQRDNFLQKVSSFISGLVLLAVMLQPIPKIKEFDWDLKVKQYQQEFEEKKEELEAVSVCSS